MAEDTAAPSEDESSEPIGEGEAPETAGDPDSPEPGDGRRVLPPGLVRLARIELLRLTGLTALSLAILPWPAPVWSVALGAGACLTLAWQYLSQIRRRLGGTLFGNQAICRLLLSFVPMALWAREPDPSLWAVLGLISLPGANLLELALRRVHATSRPRSANLPGSTYPARPRWEIQAVVAGNLLATPVAVALVLLGAWGAAAGAAAIVLALAVGAVLAHFTLLALRTRRANARMWQGVAEFAPRFLLYTASPANAAYQVRMWLPYLDRIGLPYLIVVRVRANVDVLADQTDAPIVHCARLGELDGVVLPSVSTCFYVNNSARNTELVRFKDLTHVLLLHGDSEKPSSYNPMSAMYDRLYVAGQAAVDRYADNGVRIPTEKFRIVGRPQVEDIARGRSHTAGEPRTVLYAPTWSGFHTDADYCSLPVGADIVRGLLDRGARVIFRTHPFTRRRADLAALVDGIWELLADDAARTGTAHLWGPAAETDMDVVDCFNASDALISDVSSVVNDYLFSEKPYAITAIAETGATMARTFPLAAGGYTLEADLSDLPQVLDGLLVDDVRSARRTATRIHYLGDFPEQGYGEVFVTAAREEIAEAEALRDPSPATTR